MNTKFIMKGQRIPAHIEKVELHGKVFYDVSFGYHKQLVEEIKESTEKRQWINKTKTWRLEKSPRNDFVLSYLQGYNPYKLYDEFVNDANSFDTSGVFKIPKDFWHHQLRMYVHIMSHKRCIVAGETRTGKTRPTFTAISHLNVDKAWWIAPKSALRGLKLELNKWNYPLELVLMTYDKFRSRLDLHPEDLKRIVPKFIVFDEAHKLKNPNSKQGRLARQVAQIQLEVHGDDAHIVLLSGTPTPKDPSDWWNLTEVCCPGFLREGTQMMLKKRLGVYEQRENPATNSLYWHLIKWKEDEVMYLHKRLSGMVEVFLRKDCLDLPEKMKTLIHLEIPHEYKQAARLASKLEKRAAQLQSKLRQISDGIMYINEIDEVTATSKRTKTEFFPNCPKDEQLKNDLAEFEDVGRVIVYCAFQGTIDKLTVLCIREGWAVLKVDGRNWEALNTTYSVEECLKEMDGSNKSLNSGDITQAKIPKLVFLANQGAASTGLELSASPIIINYSQAFNMADQEQAEGRAYSNNMDKVRGLEIRTYVNLPIDELVHKNLELKKTLQSITMGDINEAMKGVL